MERFKLSYTRSRRQKIIITLAAIIVFVTTYALILPAITIDTARALTSFAYIVAPILPLPVVR